MLKTNELYLKKLEEAQARALSGYQRKVATALPNASGALDADLLGGLTRSVRNGQTRLALEYVLEIFEAQAAQIAELQELLAENEETDLKPSPPPSPETKVTEETPKPKNPRKKVEPTEEAPTE